MKTAIVRRVQRADDLLFARAARADLGRFDRLFTRLTRAADHGVLWMGVAGALAATPTGRRAAVRGLASLGVASTLANGPGKWSVRRDRPVLVDIPPLRVLSRQPVTTSFPSGHSASAAAFATAVLLDAPAVGGPVAVVAAGVAYGRIHTGVHYPSDVVAGLALGAATAVVVRRLWPTPSTTGPAAAPPADAPALPDGEGLVVVVNASAGSADVGDVVRELAAALPRAEVVSCPEDADLASVFTTAARRATALGVAGGDGTVACAAAAAIDAGRPLAVLPAGTLNHFAADLGLAGVEDVAGAVRRGSAVEVDVGIVDDGVDAQPFLNTFSLGVYPELVRRRERHERWLGKWPALAVALTESLRHEQPVDVDLDGRRRQVWLLFAGNGRYAPTAFATGGRRRLDEGVLDVRIVWAERRWARARVVAAALGGRLERSGVYSEIVTDELALRVHGRASLARDGEAATAPERLRVCAGKQRLVVYRPTAT